MKNYKNTCLVNYNKLIWFFNYLKKKSELRNPKIIIITLRSILKSMGNCYFSLSFMVL